MNANYLNNVDFAPSKAFRCYTAVHRNYSPASPAAIPLFAGVAELALNRLKTLDYPPRRQAIFRCGMRIFPVYRGNWGPERGPLAVRDQAGNDRKHLSEARM